MLFANAQFAYFLACAVCYGNPDHAMSKGLNAGVLVLLGFIIFLLIGFGAFIFFVRHRIKKLSKES